jgi:hypothetical protein
MVQPVAAFSAERRQRHRTCRLPRVPSVGFAPLVMLSKTYDALIAAGAPEDKARAVLFRLLY